MEHMGIVPNRLFQQRAVWRFTVSCGLWYESHTPHLVLHRR